MAKKSKPLGPCGVCGREPGSHEVRCPRCEGGAALERMYESPIPARILAVDPGARSGWALITAAGTGRARAWAGSGSPWTEPREVLHLATGFLGTLDAVVIERPGMGGTGHFMKMVVGLAETAGAWRYAALDWCPTAVHLPVMQTSWRSGLLGGATGSRTRDNWKRASIEHAVLLSSETGAVDLLYKASPASASIEHDAEAADALGLGWWALHSTALADALGARRLAALGWDDKAACLAAKKIRTNDRSAR